jgi:hypothetical protein
MNRSRANIAGQLPPTVTTGGGECPCLGTCAGTAVNSCPMLARPISRSSGRSGLAAALSASKSASQHIANPSWNDKQADPAGATGRTRGPSMTANYHTPALYTEKEPRS